MSSGLATDTTELNDRTKETVGCHDLKNTLKIDINLWKINPN